MKRSKISLRKLLVAAAFAGVMGFGAMQVVASSTGDKTQARSCNPYSCARECPPEFGGVYMNGRCYCCG